MAASLHLASYGPREAARMLRRARAIRRRVENLPGVAAARIFFTAEFDPLTGGLPQPTRWGLFCGWKERAPRDDFFADQGALGAFGKGAKEVWGVALDTAMVVQGSWQGWTPSTDETEPLGQDEPVAVMTYGRVRPRYIPHFTWHNRRVVRSMDGNPATLMKVGLGDDPLARSTFSIWRSKGDVVRFAYGKDTVHDPVQRHSLDVPWGYDYFFARFRPVASTGTWRGRDPLRPGQ